MMCYECDNLLWGCDTDPDHLARCEPGTTMCYAKMYGRTGIEQYERGCLPKGGRHWKECMVEQSNKCFTCFGSGCNHMPLLTPSTLRCIQCEGEACDKAMEGERCLIPDTIFGPAMCVSKYVDHGKDIELKDCWNAIYKKTAGFKRHLHYTCLGQMCNFQKDDVLERCIEYRGHAYKYKPKLRMCMAGSFPERYSKFMGCYRDISGKYSLVKSMGHTLLAPLDPQLPISCGSAATRTVPPVKLRDVRSRPIAKCATETCAMTWIFTTRTLAMAPITPLKSASTLIQCVSCIRVSIQFQSSNPQMILFTRRMHCHS